MNKNECKFSTNNVGENFEIYWSQVAKNAFKLSTMVGENFKIYWPQVAKNAFKLSTMVGENFEIYWPQIPSRLSNFLPDISPKSKILQVLPVKKSSHWLLQVLQKSGNPVAPIKMQKYAATILIWDIWKKYKVEIFTKVSFLSFFCL